MIRLLLIAGSVVAVLAGTFYLGHRAGAAACESRWQAKEQARISAETAAIEERNLRIDAAVAATSRKTAEREAALNNLQDQVDAYESQLAADPGCVLSPDDASSLSNIK